MCAPGLPDVLPTTMSPSSKVSSIPFIFTPTSTVRSSCLPSKGRRFSFAPLPEVEKFITSQARVRNNVITERREICLEGEPDFRDITDRDENTLWARANKMGVYSGAKTIQMILNSEYVDDYHPFVSYLDGLDAWDGKTDYIRLLANTVHTADQELFLHLFPEMVRRLHRFPRQSFCHQPGGTCINRQTGVLQDHLDEPSCCHVNGNGTSLRRPTVTA